LGASLGRAEQLPLWEAGTGIGAATLPHYRGSDQSRTWVLPVPYLVYRGESLKVDDDRRLRGLFSDKVELEFSLSGSPPARDDARRGMPDLDATLELGPSLNIALFRSENGMEKLELRLPVRAVVASDFSHFRHAGWIFQPNLSLDFRNVLGNRGWNLGLQSSLIYTDRRYNQYFYAVDPIFATAERPAFNPGGGYAGTAVIAALSKRFSNFWVGGFAKWDSVGGAVFADSPLVKSRSNLSGGLGIAWILRASSAHVDAEN
jgi:outer membrane scaffolding protein for murein synthesis (MipA/OmpV family)